MPSFDINHFFEKGKEVVLGKTHVFLQASGSRQLSLLD